MNMAQTANMTALDNNNGDQSQNSFEQLCQVALHEKQACVNAAEVNSLGDSSNIVMVLAPPPPPKVTNNDVDHRGHVTQNYLDKIRSHCNNVTLYVKSENGSPSSNNYQEGTIREIRSRSRKDSRDSFSEAFQSTTAQMSLNAEQRSPTFPQQYRKTRDFIPEDLKDEGYWIKRKKNNEAAKRSREKRRNNDAAIEAKVNLLQQMNDKLTAENSDLKKSLAEANEKIQYLQTERALKITNPMPSTFNLEHVGKLTTASTTNISAQSTPFFYIPQGASNPNPRGPDQQMEQIVSQSGAQVCGRNQNLNIVQSQTMNQNFNLDQNSNNSAAILPSASSIMQQSIHRKNLNSGSSGGAAGNAAALGQHGANSIILPLQSISAALGPAVQQSPNQNPGLAQNNNTGAGSVVYLNTGASVVPINATLVQAASVSSASLIPQGVTALPHHSQPVASQNTAVVGTADIQQSASATPTKLLAQAQPVLKPASLVSLSTPIDNIIPLKKRFKDSNSSSPQNCPSNANQTSPVAVGVAGHHHRKGNLTPASAFILHSDSSGDFTTDTGESNSNPEYWKTQLITIMSEVERLKHQMGSIQQSSTTTGGSPSQQQQHQTLGMVASPSGGTGTGTPNNHQHHHHHQQQPSVAPPLLNPHSHPKPLEMSPLPPPPQAPTTASNTLPAPLGHQLMTSAMNMNTSSSHSNGSNAPTPSPAATITTEMTESPRVQDS